MSTPRAWASAAAGPTDDASGVVEDFVLDRPAVRIVFGNGAVDRLSDEVGRMGVGGLTVVCTPALGRRATRIGRSVATAEAGAVLRDGDQGDVARIVSAAHGTEGFLAIGGGSAIGAARRAAAVTQLPVIAVPTTYAGREMSWEQAAPLPTTVVYDPVLTTTLPQQITGVSALAAIARAALALCAGIGNPLTELTAGLAIRYLAEGAHDAVLHPRGLVGRSRALYGAHLVGLVTAGAPRTLERTDHTLARAGGVHSSDVTAVLLAHRLEAAGQHRPIALAAVAAALNRDDAVTGALELAADLGAPTSFAQLGLEPARLLAIKHAAQRLEVSQAERRALRQALRGRSPATSRARTTTERGDHP